MIAAIDLYDLRLPLTVPYGNSMGVLREFTATVTVLTDENGRVGMGEGTPAQPGYQKETPESVWEFVWRQAPEVLGQDIEEAYASIKKWKGDFPLAVTTYLTALEELRQEPILALPEREIRFPLVGIVNPSREETLEGHVEKRLRDGFTTLKIKIGFDLDADIKKVKKIQAIVGRDALLRLDANQAYSMEQALRFVHSIDPINIELLEQPFAAGLWEPMIELAPQSPLPLMLDESIFNEQDVIHTGEYGCAQFIKFKLMKSASAVSMQREMETARRYGIKVLIGNGVSSDIGCFHETLIAVNGGVAAAGEQNGYLKPTSAIFTTPLGFANGHIVIPAGYKRELNQEALRAFSRDHRHLTKKG